jgi:predicted ribosomally synthesized peptide with SipW-like signal peptide
MSTKAKRYLMLLVAVGLIAVAAGGSGTFASFTAQATQSGNTFETGSLILSETSNAETACFSSAGTDNVNDSCSAIFTGGDVLFNAGDTAITGHLTLNNTGSISPAALNWYAPKLDTLGALDPLGAVCQSVQYTPTGDTSGINIFHGNGNLCTGLQLQIQETTSNTFGTPTASCVFPASGSACNTNFGSPSTLPTVASPLGAGTLTNGTPRFFKITLKFPGAHGDATGADNQYMALKSYFDLTWRIEQ